MPGRTVSAKSVAAANEAASKVHPVDNKSKGTVPAPAMKDSRKPSPKTSDPKKEMEYVEYKVGAEKPKGATRRVKNDLKMLDIALVDSAVAKSHKGKNVKQIAPKKAPILPHHHGGPAPTKKPVVRPLAE